MPNTNWADRHRPEDRAVRSRIPTKRTKQGVETKDICPAAMGGKNQQPAAFSPSTKLIYAGINNLCMNYEGVEVQYIAGAPYVGANVRIFAGPGGNQGEFIAWDPVTAKRVWGIKEPFPVWTGALVTAGDVAFYGTMDGWFKAVNAKTGMPLWKSKLPSGIDRRTRSRSSARIRNSTSRSTRASAAGSACRSRATSRVRIRWPRSARWAPPTAQASTR